MPKDHEGRLGPSPAPAGESPAGAHSRGPVLVTGANGYVASWLVRRLLERGFRVHATVRDPDDPARTAHLNAIARDSPGTLSLFRADLVDPAGFGPAMAGCGLVFHTASPLIVRGVEDPLRDLVEPASAGTRHVLEAASRTPSVRRVVLTSSIVAVYGDAADVEHVEGERFDETHWNTTSSARHQPYSYSKTVAERLAWEIARRQSGWELVALNPGLVLGPALSPHTKAEGVLMMRDLGGGYYRFGAPDLEFAVVDVRDVAEAHLRAALSPDASGRHILVSESLPLIRIAEILREHYGEAYPFPRRTVSNSAALMLAPTRGIPQAVARRNLGYPLRFDNGRSRTALGMVYRPASESVADHFRQLLDDGLVKAPA